MHIADGDHGQETSSFCLWQTTHLPTTIGFRQGHKWLHNLPYSCWRVHSFQYWSQSYSSPSFFHLCLCLTVALLPKYFLISHGTLARGNPLGKSFPFSYLIVENYYIVRISIEPCIHGLADTAYLLQGRCVQIRPSKIQYLWEKVGNKRKKTKGVLSGNSPTGRSSERL